MLRGRFGDTSGRPYIEGRLIIPRLSIRADISFCVDTGADRTILLPTDGTTMNLDYDDLVEDPRPSIGLGGVSFNYVEPAIVVFNEPGKVLHAYNIVLMITEADPELMDLPSLLGRDILNQWRMRYFPTSNRLTFDVVTADVSIPV